MLFVRYRRALELLRVGLKPAIALEFWSTLIFTVSFAPAVGWLLNRLVASSGQFAVSDHDLVAFVLSPHGILFLLLSVCFVLVFWFAEQVGLLIISVNAVSGNQVSVSLVLWEKIRYFPALFRLGLLQGVVYLGIGIPFGLGLWLTYALLLREWDIYYYLNVQPLRWWIALIIAAMIAVVYLLLAAWLYIRWLFAVPVLVYEHTTVIGALRKSWRQTRGRFREFAVPMGLCWVIVFILSLTITWLVRSTAAQLFVHAGLPLKVVIPAVIVTLALITIPDIMLFIIGKIAHVMLMAHFYLETTDLEQKLSPTVPAARILSPTALKRVGWLIAGVVLIMGAVVGAVYLRGFNVNRAIEITGHRGSKLRAPENSLSAIRQAIAEGADYAEIDVQTTADGVVVLLHDADLMRVASVNRRLRDIEYHELKDIDVGSWFAPEFRSERIPTLQEAIDVARGRIKLNIELKYTWKSPFLAEKVGTIIRQKGFLSECVVSSLNFQALTEIKQAFPEVTTGFIVFKAAGNLSRMGADFLSINKDRATPRLVRQVHRHGRTVHVWTVNDFNNIISMIEVGVDNIITDYPQKVRRILEVWNALSGSEKIILMLRNLMLRIQHPEPSDL